MACDMRQYVDGKCQCGYLFVTLSVHVFVCWFVHLMTTLCRDRTFSATEFCLKHSR